MLTYFLSGLIIVLVVLLFLVALVIFRGMMYGRIPDPVTPVDPVEVEGSVVAEHLAEVIQFPTVSHQDRSKVPVEAFESLHRALERMYPRAHTTLKCEKVNNYSLLYTWLGHNLELDPVLLMGHLDVVPAEVTNEGEWKHPPFSGEINDGFVWGRGALDMKGVVVGIFEAVEMLLKQDYKPERTLYLALGHDEEIGGQAGAMAIASLLESRGVRLMAVLDEGGSIMQGLVPGVEVPVALIGVAEKGHATLELKVEGRPGHSSAPPKHTGIGVLARAITRLENHPMPARLSMAKLMFDELGAFLPTMLRMALANGWLFDGLIRKRLSRSPMSDALIRTTTAVTVVHGGVKDNILPAMVEARVNFRILPGDRVADVMAHARKVINDDAVQINLPDFVSWEPSPISPIDSPVYKDLAETIREVYPESIVAPFLVIGATDSRHYGRISDCIYRFSPYLLDSIMVQTVHGYNERISIDALPRMVQFYSRLIDEWTGS